MLLQGNMRRQVSWLLPLLWLALVLSALSVIYVSHLCRQLYNELSKLEQEANALQVEWGRYLLEQSSWASLSRVEQLAESQLQMRVPEPDEIIIVRAQAVVE
ncbi:cell division protein FtsL [Porticoccus sp.]